MSEGVAIVYALMWLALGLAIGAALGMALGAPSAESVRREKSTGSRRRPGPTMSTIRLTFRTLIYREDTFWLAHCLETDVVAEGLSSVEALTNLIDLMKLQIDVAMEEGDLESIFRSAPAEIQAMYARATDEPFDSPPPQHVERFDVRKLQPA